MLYSSNSLPEAKYPDINKEIEAGNFKKAGTMIDERINKKDYLLLKNMNLVFRKIS